MYTFRRRSLPYPALQNFDTPNGDFSCVRRQRSNTPLQALTTLNEVIFTECARSLAQRTLAMAGPSDERACDVRLSLLCRPTAHGGRTRGTGETRSPTARAHCRGLAERGEIATGQNKLPDNLPPGTTPAQLAAYTVAARVVLNLDETITKE